MNIELNHLLIGFLAHTLGGLIAGLFGWFGHSLYDHSRRKRYHVQFDRDIIEFVHKIRDKFPAKQMPELMRYIVPLASKARFGVDVPPLKEEHSLPKGTTLYCKYCKRNTEPSTEGRCKTCTLGCGLWHEPAK